ncbi:uncharacterized protein LOC124271107 [Haliotis rubra]|uniref:uncharacterized protein LOC124271107 n=1 Tax=Haliotis rubra TaxID=36100 RepID=UPI001EE56525|nr:uncharacterized protein LOC124271107 [Haliotis rubra]
MADPTDGLTEEIMNTLPNIDDTLLQSLMGRLMSLGVETVDDIGLLQEQDLEGFLKPIQIRKILTSGGQVNVQLAKRSSSQFEPSSPVSGTASMSPLSSLGSPSQIFFENSTNTDPNWAYKVDIPWTKMGRDITDPLQRGKRLMPDARRKLVRIIVDEIRERTFHATKTQFSVIAKRIVQRFPKSLEDRIEDIVVGTGYDLFAKQLLNRNDNLNRPMGVKMGVKTSDVGESSGKRNDSQEVQVVGETSKKKVDSYGCINFSPSLNSDTAESLEEIREDMCRKYNNQNPKDHDWEMKETQLRDTYSLQRYNINEGESVRDLLSKWPFLFTERGLFLHFKLLVGLDIRNTICEAFSKKAHRLNKFFKTEESGICKEADEIIKEAKAQSAKDSVIAWLPANILAIMKYFSEKEEQLFLTVDVRT